MAESFGSDPARYDETRPRYPAAPVEAVIAGSPGLDLVDVGGGTGIAARQFQAAGCNVLGVEVDGLDGTSTMPCAASVVSATSA